jgi:hypothetical protein
MKCLVCFASFPGAGSCPNCQYDHAAPDATDPRRIVTARAEFRARTLAYAPETRVTAKDRRVPWLGLALGAALFLFWLRACSSFRFF